MNFLSHVRDHFDFLLNDFGFNIESSYERGDTATTRYSSDRVYVVISRGPPDFEPKMSFGRVGVDDQVGASGFEQGDLVMLSCCADWEWERVPCEPFGAIVSEFARLLRQCGKQCLEGDDSVFSEMKNRRTKLTSDWLASEKTKSARVLADAAWAAKRFSDVVLHYSSISDSLSASELKRFTYAKKHQSD